MKNKEKRLRKIKLATDLMSAMLIKRYETGDHYWLERIIDEDHRDADKTEAVISKEMRELLLSGMATKSSSLTEEEKAAVAQIIDEVDWSFIIRCDNDYCYT